MDNAQLTIEIHCQNLPGRQFDGRAGIRLGIQKGEKVIDDASGDAPGATFTAVLKVSRNPATGKPNFTGPFAQGTPGERFLYLCWGERNPTVWEGFRRAKIHLRHLDWETVDTAIKSAQPITVTVNMTDDKGGPLCASVKETTFTGKYSKE